MKDGNDLVPPSSTSTSSQTTNQPRTINPSLLDRQNEFRGQRSKFTFEAGASKKTGLSGFNDMVEPRKANSGNTDVLLKAKEMGIKLWQLEKLSRVVNSMFDVPNEPHLQNGNAARMRGAYAAARGERQPDLSRMLRNERLNGPSDRDPTVALSEVIPFKGPFIYIRDIDERTKPIMVKDYPKPTTQEEGEWPQFRSARQGRCPFIEDPTRQELEAEERAKAAEQALAEAGTRTAPRTRAATIREDAAAGAAKADSQKILFKGKENTLKALVPPPARIPNMPTHEFCPPPAKTRSPLKAAKDAISNAGPRLFGGEPAASGLQQSNITSAIRSQMISSTAAAPGAKAGTSKEVHELKRKVLEKNTRPPLNSIQARQRNIDPAGTARAEKNIPIARQSRRHVPETLIHIDEETTQSEEEEDVWLAEDLRRKEKHSEKAVKVKELKGKDLKEGYCENCRKKYDHFDDVSLRMLRSETVLMLPSSTLFRTSTANLLSQTPIGQISTGSSLALAGASRSLTLTIFESCAVLSAYTYEYDCHAIVSYPETACKDSSWSFSLRSFYKSWLGVTKGLLCPLTIPFCVAVTLASAWRACLYIIDMHLQGGFL